MTRETRRDFFQRGLLTAAAGAIGLGRPSAARAIPPIGRTRPSHFKLSIAAYSYRDLLTAKPPKMDLFAFADLAADMGLDAIEPTSYYFPIDVTTEYFHRLKQHAFLLGLDISSTAIGNNFCFPPGLKRDEQLALTRTWIDRAAELDAPVIRIFAGYVPKGETEEQAAAWAIEGIKESLPYAAQKGVTLALENHGGVTATSRQILKLIRAIDHPNFGVNLDTGNFHVEDPYAELAELAPYAVTVQVKTEIRRKGAQSNEPADLARLISMLRDAKYSGYVILEYEAAEDPLEAIPRHIKKLRELIS
jgi:sugar phosphate isomerase/epimerase